MKRTGDERVLDDNGLEILPLEECFRLLRSVAIGRVGVSFEVLPAIFPVNFTLDGERIVLRTSEGTKFSAALAGAVVAFEVDGYDPINHTGWSVMVRGAASVLDFDEDGLNPYQDLKLTPWANAQANEYVQIPCELVTGRQIRHW